MPRNPAYIENLKILTQSDITPDDLPALENEMYFTNDRASIIMLGTMVEYNLAIAVKRRLRPDLNSDDKRILFSFEGPLGTFSAKIVVAYALGCFGPDTHHDLNLIR